LEKIVIRNHLLPLSSLLAFFSLPAPAQDMAVRVEAVRLIEHANAVSMIAGLPDFRMDVSFHAYSVDGGRTDGAFHRILTPDGQWIECIYGPIHSIAIFTKTGVIQTQYETPPPELRQALSLLPVRLVRFDESDVIQSINDANVLGRPAKCIRFETINGKATELNELCLDSERGTLLRAHIADEVRENSDYFQVGKVWFPHEVRQYLNGKLRMEAEQSSSLLDSPVDLMTLAPPNPQILHKCKQFRPAVGVSMPQPLDAGPGPWYDVLLHIVIWADGRVHEATTLPKGHPGLEGEALRLIRSWQFDPATCEGKPVVDSGTFTIHFPPQ
jgi:Gram-negative bacterial TonB protein C-terminal